MASDNLLATLENTLRQTRSSRSRLASRLHEVEREAESLRAEIAEMDMLAAQTESTMYRFMSAVFGAGQSAPANNSSQHEQRYSSTQGNVYSAAPQNTNSPLASQFVSNNSAFTEPAERNTTREQPNNKRQPAFDNESQAKGTAYSNLTIPQATAALLRDAGVPLHVNEIYEQLLAGGFVFSGHNPTISIAVSLNRNPRFSKVSPGTFDLVLRDVAA